MKTARRQIHSPLSAVICFYFSILVSIALSLVPFVQLYYSAYLSEIFNMDPSSLSSLTTFAAVQIQKMMAHNLVAALDSGTYDAIFLQRDVSTLRLMRKSDSLNSVLRVGLLKIPPTICQVMIILQRFQLGLAANMIVLTAVLCFYSSIWTFILGPLCMKCQDAKKKRTDALYVLPLFGRQKTNNSREEREDEDFKLHTQKTYERAEARLSWALILWTSFRLVLAIDILYMFRQHDSIGLPTAMVHAYHQIDSLDDDCKKIAQSLPKAVKILCQMNATNGMWMHFKKGSTSAFEAFWRIDELWRRWEEDGQETTSEQISTQGKGDGYGTFGQYSATYWIRAKWWQRQT